MGELKDKKISEPAKVVRKLEVNQRDAKHPHAFDDQHVTWILFGEDEDYHFRYYLMNYHADSCSSSRAKWIKMRELLGLPKAY